MTRPKRDPLPFRTSTRIPGTTSDKHGNGGPRSFVFTLQDRPRATRASVPKVRSGCITCKKRHVKCDEAKPACKRCLKWQGSCRGYNLEVCPPVNGRSVTSGSNPSDTDGSQTSLQCSDGDYHAPTKPDESQWEDIYFGHWSGLSDTLGGGLFPSTLFNETVPQLSRIEPAVRCAVIAIGALASSKAPGVLPGASTTPEASNRHYNSALAYYGHALGLIRLQQDIFSDYTLRVALISCVLFACFEALHDSCDASINHINHGLMMVDQIMCAQSDDDATQLTQIAPSPSPPPPPPPPPPRDGSPTAFVLDDEILQVFQRLEYLAFGVSLLQGLPQPSRIYLYLSAPFDLSRPFTDLIEARRCLDQFQHACLRAVIAECQQRDTGNFNSSLLSAHSPLAPLEEWRAAFLPLAGKLTCGGTVNRTLPYYQATSLLLQYHTAHTSLTLVPYANESIPPRSVLDPLTPHYKEMLRLAETLMACQPRVNGEQGEEREASSAANKVFTMDHGPALAVVMTATSCIDAGVRAEALALLDRYPQRDGFWDRRRIFRCVGPNNQAAAIMTT